jgi:hypothetical protein
MASAAEMTLRKQHAADLKGYLDKRNAELIQLENIRRNNIKQLQYEHDRTVKEVKDEFERNVYEENYTFKADLDALRASEAAARKAK